MTEQDEESLRRNPEFKITPKPWGMEVQHAANEQYAGKVLHIHAGHRLSRQYHRLKTETILVLRGFLQLEVAGRCQTLEPGMSYKIESGVTHRLAASGGNCEVVEFSSPELSDVVRLEDDYGREGTEETPLG